jgi:protein DEK
MQIVGKGKSSKKNKGEPSREDMHAVVANILKEVDFNTVSNISAAIHVHFTYLEFYNFTYYTFNIS